MSLPVAYHCLWSLGLATDRGARPLVHGLLGCAFYGAIATKLLALRTPRLPRWAIPVVGATLVTTLVGRVAHLGAVVLRRVLTGVDVTRPSEFRSVR